MEDYDKTIYEIQALNEKIDSFYLAMKNMTPYPRMKYFILHICDHCNLNCAGCNHLSNLAKPRFVDRDTLKRDMVQIHKVHGDVPRIGIMGGEPLLHPDIIEILKDARDVFPESRLLLSTNGVLCKKMGEDFWNLCRDLNITIRFTRYPIKVDYDALIEELIQRGIEVDFFASTTEPMSEFQSIALDIKGECDPVESFRGCGFANRCTVVVDGRMYPCPIVQNAHFFSDSFGYQLKIENKDYIDIYKTDENETLQFLSRPIPFCRYCDVRKRRDLSFMWRTSGKNPYEWCDFTFNSIDIRFLKNKCVYIYGAGNWGRQTLFVLSKKRIPVKSFVVSEMDDIQTSIKGVPIKVLDDVKFEKNAFCVIAVYSKEARKEIQKGLIDKGIKNFVVLNRYPG